MTDPTDELRGLLDARIVWLTWKAETRPSTLLADVLPDELPLLKSALSQHEADKREIGRKDAEIERLREAQQALLQAIKPFRMAWLPMGGRGDDEECGYGAITIGDIRRIRQLLVADRRLKALAPKESGDE